MVESENDPLESFLKSIQAAISPLESNLQKVAKNFEHCFNGVVKNGSVNGAAYYNSIEQVAAQLDLNKSSRRVAIKSDDRKKWKVPIKIFQGIFTEKCGLDHNNNNFNLMSDGDEKVNVNLSKRRLQATYGSDNGWNGDGKLNDNRLRFGVPLSFVINGFVQAFFRPFKAETMEYKNIIKDTSCRDYSHMRMEVEQGEVGGIKLKELKDKEWKMLPFEHLMGFVFDQLNNFSKFDVFVQDHECKDTYHEALSPPLNKFDYFKALVAISYRKRAGMNEFFGNLKFARLEGVPSSLLGVPSIKDVGDECDSDNVNQEENGGNSLEKMAKESLSVPLLRLSTVSLEELVKLLPQIKRASEENNADEKELFSVQDFFRYTEAEGKRFFQELDRDGDGQVTLEDLEIAMTKRNLPKRYAQEFMQHTGSRLLKSFGWKEFSSLMEQKEPTSLRAYSSLCLLKSGMPQKSEILASLENAKLSANEDNAVALMLFLNADNKESISYGHFRDFMLLLPLDQLQESQG